jgi:hypothetical protein
LGNSNANGSGSGPRHALAQAIAARDAAQVDLDRAASALTKATHSVRDAEAALELAEQNMAGARDAAGTAAMESFMVGVKPNGSAALRAARLAHIEAEDALAASKSAVAKLSAALPERKKAVERASFAVIAAARNVVRAELGDVLAVELRSALDRVALLRSALFFQFRNAACPDQRELREVEGLPHLDDVREASASAELLRNCLAGRGFDEQHEVWSRLEQSFSALMKDAGAKLPVTHAQHP